MSLLDGLILHTLDSVNHVSQHSLLMEFYALDKEIAKTPYNVSDLNLYFMRTKAITILYTLKIK